MEGTPSSSLAELPFVSPSPSELQQHGAEPTVKAFTPSSRPLGARGACQTSPGPARSDLMTTLRSISMEIETVPPAFSYVRRQPQKEVCWGSCICGICVGSGEYGGVVTYHLFCSLETFSTWDYSLD